MLELVRYLLRRIIDLLNGFATRAKAFYLARLLPLIRRVLQALLELIEKLNTPEKRDEYHQRIWLPLVKLYHRLDKALPQPLRKNKPAIAICLALILVLVIIQTRDRSLERLRESGELVVITRESPATWYQAREGPAGPEFDYVNSFARYLGVDLRFEVRPNNREVLKAIASDEGHFAASGLTAHSSLEDKGFVLGPPYQHVDIQVVCRRNHGKIPRNVAELGKVELVVVADSSHESRLFELQRDHPGLSWESQQDASVDQLLQMVWRKEIDCTVANSSEVNIKRRLYPELQVAFNIEENQPLAWALSPEWKMLSDAIEEWLESIESDGTLLILKDRHYDYEEFDYVDMRTFLRRVKSRLPAVRPLFEKAAKKQKIPWTLLASVSYQESHWNRRAKSPTGVRGIMMLTLDTAKEMGVESRLDAEQSIMGGAKYLNNMEKRIPESVTGEDRWWYALAAYNVGMGHLLDARQLARELDLNPDSWLDLKGVLPLLSQKQYYKNLKYGYARGGEPVIFVSRIRYYRNILETQLAQLRGSH